VCITVGTERLENRSYHSFAPAAYADASPRLFLVISFDRWRHSRRPPSEHDPRLNLWLIRAMRP
jgi:hypothetical protein